MARAVVIFGAFLLMPLALFAQENSQLRAQIRADIVQDPRSSEMSEAEIDALVSALAEEAEVSGVGAEYLESNATFNYAALFPPPEEPSAVASTLASPLTLAVIFLLLILGAVIWYISRHRPAPSEPVV